ncbi:MAG TPA: hypothetical protein VE997_01350 [Candidatus Limnocylindria bacterium]|nr:hypothetical protein [Candidatus Limnocylindria bacterium]
MAVVVEWNGNDLPEELRTLPAGRYVIESVDELPPLTPDEDAGIQTALDALRRGEGVDSAEMQRRLDAVLKR